MISLKKQEEFDRVFNEGYGKNGKLISVVIRDNAGGARLGMIVSKKFGNAVNRNRIKRVIREAFHGAFANSENNIDLIVIPRPIAKKTGLADIGEEIISLTTKRIDLGR